MKSRYQFRQLDNMKEDFMYVIRHGSAVDEKGAIGGWTDTPLEAKGEKEAREAAKKLPDDIQLIVSSDLERAKETAKIISKEKGIPVVFDPDLRSWNMGRYAGKNPQVIEPVLEHFARDFPNDKTPGGESFNEYKDRFLEGIEKIKKKYAGKKIAILTHSHGIRILRAWEKAGQPKNLKIDMKEYGTKPMEPGGVEKSSISIDGK